MKFISNFCLFLIAFMATSVVTLLFVSNANIYSWGAAIAASVTYALISNQDGSKHDE